MISETHFDNKGKVVLNSIEGFDYLEIIDFESFLNGSWVVKMEFLNHRNRGWQCIFSISKNSKC